jgi:hypothetical protein
MGAEKNVDRAEAIRKSLDRFCRGGKIRVVETHISWIYLTGRFAFKVKKPVDFGFVNFSTLERRHFFALEELRLNRRVAPEIYLGLVRFTQSGADLRLNGRGRTVEYGVKMVQFDRRKELDRLLEKGKLRAPLLDRFAVELAAFHDRAIRAPSGSLYGTPALIAAPMRDNFRQIRGLGLTRSGRRRLVRLEEWTESNLRQRKGDLSKRKERGFIRECHGDLHLANMVLLNKEVKAFDCLEFDKKLRFIDTMSDLAFLLMDLDAKRSFHLSTRFLNRYLCASGDYPGMAVLRTYQVYRAMVRAKVLSLTLGQPGHSARKKEALRIERENYYRLAEGYTASPGPYLVILSGFSGSGKSYLAEKVAEISGAIWIRTDVERKRITGTAGERRTALYSVDMTRKTYRAVSDLASNCLAEGYPVILDGAFLKAEQRLEAIERAEELNIPWILLRTEAGERVMRSRILRRMRKRDDPSDADLKVLDLQMRTDQPITGLDPRRLIRVNTDSGLDPVRVKNRILGRIRRVY